VKLLSALLLPLPLLSAQLQGQVAVDSGALRPVVPMATSADLTGPARAGSYVSAIGRRAIAMGSETGGFEIWTWPLKLLHDFDLKFQTPLFPEPITARNLARRVEVTPAGPVITYTHPAFTVRQRVFAARDEPAIVMLLDVEAVRPMEIVAEFVSDLQLAWPAAIGGQYVFWDESSKAFILSESTRRQSAMVGSPFTLSASNQPAHDVPDAPNQLRIAVGDPSRTPMPRPGEPAGRLARLNVSGIPIVIVGATAPRDSVKALYRRVLDQIPALYQSRMSAADSVLARSLWIESPDRELDAAIRWAALNLDEAMACNPDLGCGLVAGYGPSEARGARPGFGWYFGGDASINSLGLGALGQYELARQGLEFFVRYQRADGKIAHEISQSAGRVKWFDDFPYAYYHADTSPYWLMAWGDWWKATGDTITVRRVWPAIRKAYDWCRSTVDSTTGLMLNSKGGLGAVEVGDLGVGVRSDIYLTAVWIEALDRVARMAAVMEPGKRGRRGSGLADEARKLHDQALTSLRERFWLPEQQMYAFALLEGGEIRPELTVWPSTALAFGLLDDDRGTRGASAQARSALVTDWGTRSLGSTSTLFDPLHYNNGTVWPFVTGFSALGQYRYRNPAAGYQSLRHIARSGFGWGLGRNPEVFAGMQNEPLETAVPQQFFGTSFLPTVLVRGLLGWEPDLPARTIHLAPQLPAEWDSLRVHNAPAGKARFDLQFYRAPERMRVEIRRTDTGPLPADTLVFTGRFPPGASCTLDEPGSPWVAGATRSTARGDQSQFRAPLQDLMTLTLSCRPGYEVLLPRVESLRGERSREIRLIDHHLDAGTSAPPDSAALVVLLEGPAGTTARIVVRRGDQRTVPVTFPLPGDPVDGYSRAEVVVRIPWHSGN
jgi:glycogen debranching enzyme